MLRRSAVPALVALAAAMTLAADAAAGSGLPVLAGFLGSPHGIATPDGGTHYRTLPEGRRTALRVTSARGVRRVWLPGRWTIPVVAYDGATSGLSTDGSTLALSSPRTRFPQRATHLLILGARTLTVRRTITLRGDFGLDAISPDGRWLYLIQYTNSSNPVDYRVRALDTGTGRLLARTIVDPTDPGEAMHGTPITRLTGAGGRWDYTLYDAVGHPFVHALDTTGLRARCIDLPRFPSSANPYAGQLRLDRRGHELFVSIQGRPLARIDTRTLRALTPSRGAAAARRAAGPGASDGTTILTAVLAAIAVLCAGLLAGLLRRRRLTVASQGSAR